MVQHRFGEIRDARKNEGGTRDDKNCNGGMRDKNTSAGAEFAHADTRMGDSFKIDGGMRVDACGPSQKICLEQDGMSEPKLVAGCGTSKAYDRPSIYATSYKLIHLLKDRITLPVKT